MVGEGVEVAVRGGVVGLAGGAGDPGGGGEEGEGGEVVVAGQVVEVPRAVGLRFPHRGELLTGHPCDETVIHDTRGMDHRGQRMIHINRGDHPGQRLPISHVTRHHPDPGAGRLQLRDQTRRTRRRHTPTTDQQHRPGPVPGHQMPGHHPTQRPGTPSDQHRAPRISRPTDRQHHLPDMPGLTHKPERVHRPPHIPDPHRQPRHRTRTQQPHHLGQQLPDPIRTRLDQIERPIPDPDRQPRLITNIRLTHLHEPATRRQQPQRRIHELASQRVQHHIHTPTTSHRQKLVREPHIPRRPDMRIIQTQTP